MLGLAMVFVGIYFIPWDEPRVTTGILEGFQMLGEYARQHVLLCLVPAMFIAGAIGVFLNQQAVMKYLGPKAPKPMAYAVASVSGAILAVCSCTVLPLFKGIYRKARDWDPRSVSSTLDLRSALSPSRCHSRFLAGKSASRARSAL
jgi:uncharacterized membrane protein YraQ (UPF0718 family)